MGETVDSSQSFLRRHWEGYKEFWSDRFSIMENYSTFIKGHEQPLSWSASDVEEFIVSDPVHGPAVLHYPLEQELCLIGHLDMKLQITTCNFTGLTPWVRRSSSWNGSRAKLKEGLLKASRRMSTESYIPITARRICCMFCNYNKV